MKCRVTAKFPVERRSVPGAACMLVNDHTSRNRFAFVWLVMRFAFERNRNAKRVLPLASEKGGSISKDFRIPLPERRCS